MNLLLDTHILIWILSLYSLIRKAVSYFIIEM